MSQIKTLNGVQYTLPQYNDTGWGANTGNVLTQYLAAIADVTLQLSGGAFTLTADANFGATYGLVSAYFTSRTTTPATAGAVRLAKTDVISWRNNANGANIDLSKDTSDNLKWNATKVLLSGAVVNADINAAAAIAYSKLALTGSIVNADIGASAAIAMSKLAALTVSRALVSDGSGLVSVATTTATEIGYVNGVTSAIQTQLDAKLTNGAAAVNVGASGTAGTLSVFPTTAAKGKITLTTADNSGNTTTNINAAAQAAARTYTIPDAGASASFVMSAGTQTVSGVKTFDGQLIGKGTATNDDAAAGYIGEYISSSVSSVNSAANNTAADLTSITLTAGDWDIQFNYVVNMSATTWTQVLVGVGTVTGNDLTGVTAPGTEFLNMQASASNSVSLAGSIAQIRKSISGSTTFYLKQRTQFSAGTTPVYFAQILARRIR